jgi:NTP pyrophosphatase (non-canonical NTP hydrolase)|tara:strand:+ start:49 stop:513 length:465 start_codon:yes stop_codon:yes gene_type:complete
MDILEKDRFVEVMTVIAEAVYNFHDRWGFTHAEAYKDQSDQALAKERIPIIKEEVKEWQAAIKNFRKDPANFDEETGDLLWVTMGNLMAVATSDARDRIVKLVVDKNESKNIENYAIRKDTGKLISIHKPEKWEGARKQLVEEWADRGLTLEES